MVPSSLTPERGLRGERRPLILGEKGPKFLWWKEKKPAPEKRLPQKTKTERSPTNNNGRIILCRRGRRSLRRNGGTTLKTHPEKKNRWRKGEKPSSRERWQSPEGLSHEEAPPGKLPCSRGIIIRQSKARLGRKSPLEGHNWEK